MSEAPDRREQIRQVHADFIRQVVETCRNRDRSTDLETLLHTASENGWTHLVRAVRKIVLGARGAEVFDGLDEEDQVIAEAVLHGLQDPSTLPDPKVRPDPRLAAPGLAHMIHAASSGNARALALIGNMAEQMSNVGGSMGHLAGIIRPLINGERNRDRLCKGMDANGERLIMDILDQLRRLETH
ncbi:MAG: hypothetical protein LJE70_03615 [Chromatiaceae bacterium]|nr:hypothetical protein [Chromatiaceae bacterium]